jgi:hypothetical protein
MEARDCACLVPDGGGPAAARAAALAEQLAAVEGEAAEVETRNEQYKLLEARTAADRDAAEQVGPPPFGNTAPPPPCTCRISTRPPPGDALITCGRTCLCVRVRSACGRRARCAGGRATTCTR